MHTPRDSLDHVSNEGLEATGECAGYGRRFVMQLRASVNKANLPYMRKLDGLGPIYMGMRLSFTITKSTTAWLKSYYYYQSSSVAGQILCNYDALKTVNNIICDRLYIRPDYEYSYSRQHLILCPST